MRSRPSALLAGATCLAWLALATGYAGAAAPSAIDLGGEPVPGGLGSTTPDRPTKLDPGLWADTIGGSATKNTHHFTYERRMRDSTVHVGVIGAPTGDSADTLGVKVGVLAEDESLQSCESDSASTGSVAQGLLGVAVVVGPSSAEATDRPVCLSAGTLQLEVGRGFGSNTSELPVAIKIVEEAPVDAPASLPEPAEEVSFAVPAPGEGREAPGATSFADAPALDPSAKGTTVRTTLAAGTEQLWRVGVGWGQQLVARATAPEAPEIKGVYGGLAVRLRLVDPRRAVFADTDDAADDQVSDASWAADEPLDLVAGGRPLQYRDRFVNDLPVVPGDYWVAVSAAPDDTDGEREPREVPLELTVAVTGEPGDAPGYQGAVLSADNGTSVDGYSPDKPFLVAEGTFAAVASGNPVVGDDEDGGWLNGRRGAGLCLAAVSVACLAGGALRLRARR